MTPRYVRIVLYVDGMHFIRYTLSQTRQDIVDNFIIHCKILFPYILLFMNGRLAVSRHLLICDGNEYMRCIVLFLRIQPN